MLYVLNYIDKPDSLALRMATREAHLAYIAANKASVKAAGPYVSEDGQTMQGSLIVIEAPSFDDAKAFSAADPYVKAGLFADISIRPWRWTINNPEGA